MSDHKMKRFWTRADVVQGDEGFGVHLDARPLRTPAKAPLVVPSEPLAQAVAQEWNAQGEHLDPVSLSFTKLCNSAIDNMGEKAPKVVELLSRYAETDLLCYRADSPETLVARQSDVWDPLLEWVRATHGVLFVQTTGVIPVEQPQSAVAVFHEWLEKMDNFELMAAHDLIMLSGSIVIARAVWEQEVTPSEGWEASVLDDLFQIEQWGSDEEAEANRALKARDFENAAALARFMAQCKAS